MLTWASHCVRGGVMLPPRAAPSVSRRSGRTSQCPASSLAQTRSTLAMRRMRSSCSARREVLSAV